MRKSNFITLALLILAITVTAVFSLHGCSGKKEDNTTPDAQPVTASQSLLRHRAPPSRRSSL